MQNYRFNQDNDILHLT